MARVAFYTFGVLVGKNNDPRLKEFYDRIEHVFSQASDSEGFIDIDKFNWGPNALPRFYDIQKHVNYAATLSLWSDLESVCAFAYKSGHGAALKNRQEWFLKGEWPTYVAWWVDDKHFPSRAEACGRFDHIHHNGSSAFAFNFKKPYDGTGKEVELNRELLNERIGKNESKNN